MAFIANDSVLLSYQQDCILNSNITATSVCLKKCGGDGVEQTATDLAITEEYVVKFLALCSPYCPVPDGVKGSICWAPNIEAVLANFPAYDPVELTEIYNNC